VQAFPKRRKVANTCAAGGEILLNFFFFFVTVVQLILKYSLQQFRIKMKGNCENLCCGWAKATFEIFDANDLECHKHVGKIKKKWSGSFKELFTDAGTEGEGEEGS
jgi:hypothetical protein